LNKGLIFLRERELLVTGNYWNLVINFDIQWYQDTLQMIQHVFKQLELSRTNGVQPNNFINWEEVEHDHIAVNNVNQELITLSKLLPAPRNTSIRPRRKRGLINLGGETRTFFFEVATTQQMQELHDVVENIKTTQSDVIHAAHQQITYLKSIDEAVSQNTVGLVTLARILKSVITNAFAYQHTLDNTVLHLEALIHFQSNVSRILRELEFTVIQLQQSVMNLREVLETSATGKLSSILIPPHNVSKILKEVILKLPTNVSLIAGFNVESMYIYYDVATVQAYATTTAIRLVVRLPLRGADRVKTLFRNVPLPTYSKVLARHIQIEPEAPYLAVTENGQYYSLLTTADLQQCKQGLFAICEATFPFIHKTRASCSSVLYFGQTEVAHATCRKCIHNENFSPVWLVAKGVNPFWIYSQPLPMMITKKCKVNGTT
jgi:hypothetical protein